MVLLISNLLRLPEYSKEARIWLETIGLGLFLDLESTTH